MKKTIIGGLLALVLSANIMAQTNVVKVNYLSIAFSSINLGFEHKLNDYSTVQLQGYYWLGGEIAGVGLSGYGVTPEFRFYPGGDALRGFFLAPYVRYQNYGFEFDTYELYTQKAIRGEADFNSFGGGLLLGGQWLFGDMISLDIYGGPGYNMGSYSYEGSYTTTKKLSFDGLTFRFGTTIGFAF